MKTGRFQTFGVGLQADPGTAVAPTVWLAVTENGSVIPDPLKTRPDYAYESRFQQAQVLQGITWKDKNVGGLATPAWVKLTLEHMFGAAVAGVITPGNTAVAELFPVKPLTVEGKHPRGNLKVTDVCCTEFTLTMVNRNSFTISHSFTGLKPEVLAANAVTPAVIPVQADQWKYSEFTAEINNAAVQVESCTLTVKNGLVAKDASGSLYMAGFSPEEPIEVYGSITVLVDNAAANTAQQASEGTTPVKLKWTKGAGKNLEVAGPADIETRSQPNGLGSQALTYTFRYVSVAGAAPCTFTWS